MSSKVKRYTIVILLGACMNLGFYQIAHTFHLPAWIDNVGTAYVALILEPTAGLLVAFATNFYQAAAIYGSSSLVYYATSAVFALAIGIGLRKKGRVTWSRLPLALFVLFVSSTFIAGSITLWRGGVADSGWEQTIFSSLVQGGWSEYLAVYGATAALKFVDICILLCALPILYIVTPKSVKNEQIEEIVTWKEPYFEKKEHKKASID